MESTASLESEKRDVSMTVRDATFLWPSLATRIDVGTQGTDSARQEWVTQKDTVVTTSDFIKIGINSWGHSGLLVLRRKRG